MLDQAKEIQSLKKKISELESKIQDKDSSFAAFGRSYSKVGSSDSDFLIRTKGQVKIQWGSKFIDLIKDGKINVDSKFIYKESKVGVKDGIYVVGEGDESQVILKIGDTELSLKEKIGTTYVSFQEEQKSSSEQKYQALQNIGFLYKDLNSIDTNSLQNGIIYVESEQKLYIIQNGILTEFSISIPNPYTKQFVIAKTDDGKGALIIRGSGIDNSLAFDTTYIYVQDGNTNIESQDRIYFKIDGQEKIIISNDSIIFSNKVISQTFESSGANSDLGFRLYMSGNKSTLEVDNLIVRSGLNINLPISMYPKYWYYENNIIKSVEFLDDEESENSYRLQLSFENKYQVGDSLYVYYYQPADEESQDISNDQLILIPFKVTEASANVINVQLQSDLVQGDFTSNELSTSLINQTIFLVGSEITLPVIIRRTSNGFDILQPRDFNDESNLTKVQSRFGNLSELSLKGKENNSEIPITGSGVYSNNGVFLKAQYTKDYNLANQDNSTKFVSTEWIHKLLPKGSIIMFGGASADIPDGWAICDGQNGTPNLVGKFIKAGSTSGEEGGEEEIKLTSENMPEHTHTFVGGTFQTSVDGEHTHTVSYKSGDLGDIANNRNNIIGDQATTTSSAGAHSHTIDMSSVQLSQEGQGTPLKWEPKYYSLIYIMKII